MATAPERGEPITAKFLGELADGVNSLDEPINGPQQIDELPPPDVSDAVPTVPDYVFTETSRLTATVQVFDQNLENYADVERIESITFQNELGEILRLDFNNT